MPLYCDLLYYLFLFKRRGCLVEQREPHAPPKQLPRGAETLLLAGGLHLLQLQIGLHVLERELNGVPVLHLDGKRKRSRAHLIAARVLDVPQEPRMDKGIPFTEVPTGAN